MYECGVRGYIHECQMQGPRTVMVLSCLRGSIGSGVLVSLKRIQVQVSERFLAEFDLRAWGRDHAGA